MKRLLFIHVLSAALLASVCLGGCKKKNKDSESKESAQSAGKEHTDEPEGHEELPTKVRLTAEVLAAAGIRTMVVTKKPLPATVDLTGEVIADPDRTARVTARVPGRIVEVRFKEGERVKAGAVLVVIESAELARVRASFASSQARGQSAQKNAERLGNLAKTGLAADQEVSGATAEARALQAEAGAAQRTLQSFGLSIAELSQNGSRFELRARIEGFVVSRSANAIADQTVTAEQVLAEIVNLDHAYFLGRLFEKNLELVKVGVPAEVRLNAYSKEVFLGKVESIGKQLDPIARTVVARIAIDNRDDLLKVGLFGVARVNSGGVEPEESTLVAPLNAVTQIAERDVVFVRHPDSDFEVHPVTLGRTASGEVQILSGLRAGEQVVVEGVFTLKSAVLKSTFGEED